MIDYVDTALFLLLIIGGLGNLLYTYSLEQRIKSLERGQKHGA